MRMSRLLLKTLREAPADADLPSHKLLIRAGLVSQLAAGLYSTLLRLGTPAYLARLWWRGRREPPYRQFVAERLGLAQADGVTGLQTYIRGHRQKLFIANISRKLLAYALNRSLQLSDEPVVENMQSAVTANGYKFSTLVETIVTSPQFLNKRVREAKQ